MRLAVFTVCMPDYDLEPAAKLLAELGYQGVEWRVTARQMGEVQGANFWVNNRCTVDTQEFIDDPLSIKRITDSAGLKIPSLGTYVSADELDTVENLMRSAKAIGVPCLRVGLPRREEGESYDQIFDRGRKAFDRVQDLARQYGVKALVEIHHGRIVASASAARRFVEGFDPDCIGVIHDAGNMVHEGYESYLNGVQILGKYLAHVHIKNAVIVPTEQDKELGYQRYSGQWAPMRKGMVDFPALLSALKAVGYDGWLSLEDFSTELSTRDKLADDREFLLKVAESVGF